MKRGILSSYGKRENMNLPPFLFSGLSTFSYVESFSLYHFFLICFSIRLCRELFVFRFFLMNAVTISINIYVPMYLICDVLIRILRDFHDTYLKKVVRNEKNERSGKSLMFGNSFRGLRPWQLRFICSLNIQLMRRILFPFPLETSSKLTSDYFDIRLFGASIYLRFIQ
jgi:hypothetical protein